MARAWDPIKHDPISEDIFWWNQVKIYNLDVQLTSILYGCQDKLKIGLRGDVPYYLWNESRPDYKHIKIWWFWVYIINGRFTRNKWDKR